MRVSVVIKPNSKHHESVELADSGELLVRVKAPAVEGKANKRALQLLAEYYHVSQGRVKLVRGASSKNKTFEVDE